VSEHGREADRDEPEAAAAGSAAMTPAGQRPLTRGERTILGRRARLLEARVGLLVMAFPPVLFIALAIGTLVEEPSSFVRGIGSGGMALLLGVCVAIILIGRNWWIESRAVRRDARLGYVERYQVVLNEALASHPWLAKLMEEGLLTRGAPSVHYLEVLPTSGCLWRANGTRLHRWAPLLPARFTEVAVTPPFAAIAAEWVEPPVGDTSGLHVGERELTEDEILELKRYSRRQRFHHARIALPLTLWFGTVLGLCLQSGRFPTYYQLVLFIGLGVATVAWDTLLIACLFRTRLLTQDARVGRVVIARFAEDAKGEAGTAAELSSPIEFLPVSGAEWTSGGLPAEWRVSGGA
jgi:hypothetical protein